MKRQFQQANIGNSVRSIGAPLAKRPFQLPPQQLVCGYCQKPGHNQHNCHMANGLCLACGSGNHSVGDCPFKKIWNAAPTSPALLVRVAPPALSAPQMRRNPGPTC